MMSREKIIANLKFARKEYIFHVTNDRGYPMKAPLIEYFKNECLRYREMLKAVNA